jgi:tetratricopeptide (TPR) repeat protein
LNCYKHKDKPAIGQCSDCGILVCEDCQVKTKAGTGYLYSCPECNGLTREPPFEKKPKIMIPKPEEHSIPAIELSLEGKIPGKKKPIRIQEEKSFQPYIEIRTPLDEDVTKGREFKKLGEKETALEHYKLALEIDPKHEVALRESFKIYISSNDLSNAKSTLDSLMEAYVERDKRAEALVLFSEAMAHLPDFVYKADNQIKIAQWLSEVEDFQSALSSYKKFVSSYPDDERVPFAIIEIGLISKNYLENNDLAMKCFRKLIEDYPESPEAKEAKLLIASLESEK